MIAVELFAGTGSFSKAWRELGGKSFTIELDPQHGSDMVEDVRQYALSRAYREVRE